MQLYLHPAQKRIMSVFFDKDFEYQPYRLHLAADCKIDMCVRFSKTAIHVHRSACIHADHAHVRTEEQIHKYTCTYAYTYTYMHVS